MVGGHSCCGNGQQTTASPGDEGAVTRTGRGKSVALWGCYDFPYPMLPTAASISGRTAGSSIVEGTLWLFQAITHPAKREISSSASRRASR